jgi:hypothetical protein
MDITAISVIVAATSVVIGIIFAVLELRNVVRQRQTDLVMRLHQRFGTKEFTESWEQIMNTEVKDYDDFVKQKGLSELVHVGSFFDGIGILLHRKLIDIDLAYELFSESTKMIWEKIDPVIEGARKQLIQPKWAGWFEYLYNEMKKREKTQQTQQ